MRIAEAWERAAASSSRRYWVTPAADYDASGEAHAAELLELLGSPADELVLLDFGCGDGRVAAPASRHFARVYGVDLAPSMLAALSDRRLENVVPILYEPGRLELPEPLDVAFSLSVLIHNDYRDGARAIADVAGVLRSGAPFFLELPVYEIERESRAWVDVGTWSPARLRRVADEAGFDVEKLHVNAGSFDFSAPGPEHGRLHVLRRR